MPHQRSIPTAYNGTQFRSRLEARVAAFMDLAGWRWDYEPVDLPGWAPDFLIHGAQPIYVEVKPTPWSRDRWSYPVMDLREFEKTRAAAVDAHVLLFGLGPAERNGDLFLGYCNDPQPEVQNPGFSLAVGQSTGDPGIAFGYCSDCDSYADRITGHHPGGRWGGHGRHAIDLWRRAGNAVQWEPTT